MEALMNPPSLSGTPTFGNVTSRLQALVVPSPRVTTEPLDAGSDVRTTAPYGVHQLRAPMSQAIARTTTPAAVAPWWMTMVVVPAVAVVSAMAVFA